MNIVRQPDDLSRQGRDMVSRAEADALGGVERLYNNTPWSLGELEQYDGVLRWILEHWMEK